MHMSMTGRQLLIGVDRLDYSKGLPDRFLAYERFLTREPDLQGLVSLLQIAPPSREKVDTYQEIRAELDSLSGRINGEFSDIDWYPSATSTAAISARSWREFTAPPEWLWSTPLRDGMNLVAKEYIAAQDPEDPGVLILSMFAGAARQMGQALIVNPFSADEVAEAIALALRMPREERVRRWRALIENVRREDVFWWRDRFLGALEAIGNARWRTRTDSLRSC
jgi:trehalose 6-phosphate synthase